MFRNTPTVTQNLIIVNIIFFVATFIFEKQGIDLGTILGAHYFNTPLFKPWQLITHAFMHADILHIFMNMYVLFMFGSFLERLWGAQRFLKVYFLAAFGAILLYNIAGYFQVEALINLIENNGNGEQLTMINTLLREFGRSEQFLQEANRYLNDNGGIASYQFTALSDYIGMSITPMVGASGAVFGLLAAFALLFPNTELQLLFPPIPVKAKYLIGGYFVLEIYSSFHQTAGDHVAHLAHVGGAVVGGIIVLIWKRNSTNFY
jgi:membrane associated rhomboid family serine protease